MWVMSFTPLCPGLPEDPEGEFPISLGVGAQETQAIYLCASSDKPPG